MTKFKERPLNGNELEENRAAIAWLLKKGLTPYEIRCFPAHWVDRANIKVTVHRIGKKRDYKFTFSYFGSPLMAVMERDYYRHAFVFTKNTTHPTLPSHSIRYEETEIARMAIRRRDIRKRSERPKRELTIPGYLVKLNQWKQFYNPS